MSIVQLRLCAMVDVQYVHRMICFGKQYVIETTAVALKHFMKLLNMSNVSIVYIYIFFSKLPTFEP